MNQNLKGCTAALMFVIFGVSSTVGQAPDWWITRGVLKPGTAADDYGALNQGQLKQLAYKAYLEMEVRLRGGGV